MNELTILSGVAASLLAIGLHEVWKKIREMTQKRALKNVLGVHGKSCIIVAPAFSKERDERVIGYRSAYAFSHLFELAHRLGVEPKLIPYHRYPDIQEANDTIVVGGPLANQFTRNYLDDCIPCFGLIRENGEAGRVEGFNFLKEKLVINNREDVGILIKLTEEELKQERSVHLIFGCTSLGSAGAAYYLWKYYRRIHKAFGKRKYCIAIKVSKSEGYKGVTSVFKDLSEEAFSTGDERREKEQIKGDA